MMNLIFNSQKFENLLQMVMSMVRAVDLILMYCCPIKAKILNLNFMVLIISRGPYIIFSNFLCQLSNNSNYYTVELFPESSYLFCLLAIAYCSDVTCLLSVLNSLLSYIWAHHHHKAATEATAKSSIHPSLN